MNDQPTYDKLCAAAAQTATAALALSRAVCALAGEDMSADYLVLLAALRTADAADKRLQAAVAREAGR